MKQMRHTCQWCVMDWSSWARKTGRGEVPCGELAVAYIDWCDGTIFWYCAEHYDSRISWLRYCDRRDVLEASGAK